MVVSRAGRVVTAIAMLRGRSTRVVLRATRVVSHGVWASVRINSSIAAGLVGDLRSGVLPRLPWQRLLRHGLDRLRAERHGLLPGLVERPIARFRLLTVYARAKRVGHHPSKLPSWTHNVFEVFVLQRSFGRNASFWIYSSTTQAHKQTRKRCIHSPASTQSGSPYSRSLDSRS